MPILDKLGNYVWQTPSFGHLSIAGELELWWLTPLSSIFQLYHGGQLQKIYDLYNTLFLPFELHFLRLSNLSDTSTKI